MDASKAPRMNLKMAIPVKEVKADMIQRLAPHPKNLKSAKGFIVKGRLTQKQIHLLTGNLTRA
jgi:hypothetical protein